MITCVPFTDQGALGALYTLLELDVTEGQAPENRCFLTVVLEKTLESPLDSKELKLVHPKGNQP